MVLLADEKGFKTITHIALNSARDLNKKALDKVKGGKDCHLALGIYDIMR